MPKRKPVESLYAELIHRGLPAEYARRTADELDDHRADLITDLKRQKADDPESAATARLGETRALAAQIARDYRRRSWFGRHPVATFVVAPIPLLALAAVLCLVSIDVGVGSLVGESIDAWLDGFSGWGRLLAGAFVCLLVYGAVVVALPAGISLGLSRLAFRATGNPRWAGVACLLIALFVGSIDYDMRLSLARHQSQFMLSTVPISQNPVAVLQHYTKPAPLAQFAMPMAMFAWVYASDRRRRRQALLAAAPEEAFRAAA